MIIAIDANGFLARHWHAAGGGRFTGAAAMLLNLVRWLSERYPEAKVVSAFDSTTPCFRKAIFPGYKAKRPAPDQEYLEEIRIAFEMVAENGFIAMRADGFEADDVIASIVAKTSDKVVILSADKDFHQLLESGRVTIIKKAWRENGGWAFEYLNATKFSEDFGIAPSQWLKFQCIAGDSCDGWPGAKGVGPKTTIDYLQGKAVKPARLAAIHKLDMELAKQICELRKDLEVEL